MSPYLFLICAEGLTSLIKQAEIQGKLHGLRITSNAPSISHLLFADNSLLFCKAKTKEAKEVMRILEIYSQASGQVINAENSLVFFSKNVKHEDKTQLTATMNNMNHAKQSKYLGLPMMIGKSKAQIFGYIKD